MFEHPSKQVAKILRTEAKKLNIKASITCEVFAGGNAVNVKISQGTDADVEKFREISKPYGYERKYNPYDDGVTVTNFRDDIPQTSWLHVLDWRESN